MHTQSKKNIFFSAFATLVEYYDFMIYAYLAPYIAVAFFPKGHHWVHLLETYALFAIGYFMRPLGGIIFGHFGDLIGRKKVLFIAVSLMAISLIATALTPDFQQVGVMSTLILLGARILQGISIGGEYNGVLATLIENAPEHKRGQITAIGTFISGNGVLLATIVVMLCTQLISTEHMNAFGWRIPYYVGCVLSVIAVLLICLTKESPHFTSVEQQQLKSNLPLKDALKQYPWAIFVVFALAGYLGIAYYMAATYLPNIMTTILHYPPMSVMSATVIAAFCYAYSAPLFGALSDKVGRKPVLLTSICLIGILIYPAYRIILLGHLPQIVLVYAILMLLISAATATFVVTINELFPTHLRFSGVAFGYNVGNAALGGTVLLVSQILVDYFHNPLAPAFYLIASSAVILIILLKLKETHHAELVD